MRQPVGFLQITGLQDTSQRGHARRLDRNERDQDFALLDSDAGKCRAKAYDLVINGYEAGGGTIRIHDAGIQQKVFNLLGIDEKSAEERFGFLLHALQYGAPPHGGIALGIDRFVMLFGGLDNIRDCIAFPKTQRASDLMTGAPLLRASSSIDECHPRGCKSGSRCGGSRLGPRR